MLKRFHDYHPSVQNRDPSSSRKKIREKNVYVYPLKLTTQDLNFHQNVYLLMFKNILLVLVCTAEDYWSAMLEPYNEFFNLNIFS